jgi:FtsP/CotA-like multicopper oxidase with cupredoxin domain
MAKIPEPDPARRDFLRLGVTIGCGLAVPPLLSACGGDDDGEPEIVETFVEPQAIEAAGGRLEVTLLVSYFVTDVGGVKTTLRSYGGVTGPTLIVHPGDALGIRVVNHLPPNPPDPDPTEHIRYHNNTNLHTHGLHVFPGIISTAGNGLYGDYVMDPSSGGIEPGQTRQHEYRLRADHPEGMFWYHPHSHGSSAMQVASWMAGALLVKGRIDQIPEMAAARERVFVFQSPIFDANGRLESFFQVADNPNTGGKPWLINGVRRPRLVMRTGEVENWRLLNAGIFNFLNLSLDAHVLYRYSSDGNPMTGYKPSPPVPPNDPDLASGIVLAPANRASVMVKALAPGTYYLRTMPFRMGSPTNVLPEDILAEIVVVDPPNPMELPRPPFPVTPFLDPITDAELAAHGGLKRSIVMRALANPWPGVPGTAAPITDPPASLIVHPGDELNDWVYNTGNSTVADNVYAIGSPATTSSPAPVAPPTTFTNPDTYIPFQSTRALTQTVALDSVEEWTVFSMNNVRHPFHIHVNPMYVVKVNGQPVEPYWADTIPLPAGGSVTQPTSITFRSRFLHYTGPYVMHCHMLAHEDLGMMQGVTVV